MFLCLKDTLSLSFFHHSTFIQILSNTNFLSSSKNVMFVKDKDGDRVLVKEVPRGLHVRLINANSGPWAVKVT